MWIVELSLHASNLTNSNTFAEVVDATTPAHKQRKTNGEFSEDSGSRAITVSTTTDKYDNNTNSESNNGCNEYQIRPKMIELIGGLSCQWICVLEFGEMT